MSEENQEPTEKDSSEIHPWDRPEHRSPRVEEPDNSRSRIAALLFVFLPMVLFFVVMVFSVIAFSCQANKMQDQWQESPGQPKIGVSQR